MDKKRFPDKKSVEAQKRNLSGADLSGADLSGADLSHSYSIETNFRNANLSGADLSRSMFNLADLSGANLSNTIWFESSLSGTNLRGANLSGADLRGVLSWVDAHSTGADLHGANLVGIDLSAFNNPAQDPDELRSRGAKVDKRRCGIRNRKEQVKKSDEDTSEHEIVKTVRPILKAQDDESTIPTDREILKSEMVRGGFGGCNSLYNKDSVGDSSGQRLSAKLIGYNVVISTVPKRGQQNGRYYAGIFDGKVEQHGELYIRLKSCHTLNPHWSYGSKFVFHPVAKIKWKEKKARDEALTELFTIPLQKCLMFFLVSRDVELEKLMHAFTTGNYSTKRFVGSDPEFKL